MLPMIGCSSVCVRVCVCVCERPGGRRSSTPSCTRAAAAAAAAAARALREYAWAGHTAASAPACPPAPPHSCAAAAAAAAGVHCTAQSSVLIRVWDSRRTHARFGWPHSSPPPPLVCVCVCVCRAWPLCARRTTCHTTERCVCHCVSQIATYKTRATTNSHRQHSTKPPAAVALATPSLPPPPS